MGNINPLAGIFDEFSKILNQMVIKYSGKAEEQETYTSKSHGDKYLVAKLNKDKYETYLGDYSKEDFDAIGLKDEVAIDIYIRDNSLIPETYHRNLFKVHHDRYIATYEDLNDYYRVLNGYPPLKDNEYYYVSNWIHEKYGIPNDVPIHKIEDVYGTYYINLIEGLGIINELKEAHPDKEYLNHIGTKRISIEKARTAKNFEIIFLNQGTIGNISFESFKNIYAQCREYFMAVIYIKEYRNVIPYYDNFIALCIFVMTMQQVVCRQLDLEIHREFFDIQALQQLYQAYGIPYDLTIDEYTQKAIAENLNLLIQAKSTDKVLYDIASILGYNNMDVYKYYLVKERKYDTYGLPIVKTKEEVNQSTGEIETVYDYEKMYDVYFRRVDLKNQNIQNVFSKNSTRVDYDEITPNDPYWIEDTKLYDELWKTEYNFVESKYFGLGVSYRMSEMIFENIFLLHMLMDKKNPISDIRITIPKIMPKLEIPIFDAIILLCALISKKYNLYGEVVTTPTQILYLMETWDQERIDRYNKYDDRGLNIVEILGFNFKAFNDPDYFDKFQEVYDLLGEEDGEKLFTYLSILSTPISGTKDEKIKAINEMFTTIKSLYKLLDLRITQTDDRKTYEALKELYDMLYYKQESDEVFRITDDDNQERPAQSYFEYLYYANPALYSSIFDNSMESQYDNYLTENELDQDQYTFEMFQNDMDEGKIEYRYDIFTKKNPFISVTDNLIYYFMDHIISQMENVIKGLNFIYLISDAASPIEVLLMKLVNYFKSFTVDAVSLSVLYITDMKVSNILRFFDEVERIHKTIEVTDDKKISYSDVIHNIIGRFERKDILTLKEYYIYNVFLYIDRLCDNKIFSFDKVYRILKETQYDDTIPLMDVISDIKAKIDIEERCFGFKEKVYIRQVD